MSQFSDEIDAEFWKWTAMMLDKKDAEITRLRADLAAVTEERDRMREALKPFRWPASAMYDAIHGEEPDDKIIGVMLKIGDMRRARDAIEVTKPANTQTGER